MSDVHAARLPGAMHTSGVVHSLPGARTDEAVLASARAGQPWAQQELFRRHSGDVQRVLSRVLGRDSDLPDLVQEVFVRAFERIDRIEEPGKTGPWIVAIAVFVARERIRSRRRKWWMVLVPHNAVEDVAGGDAPDPDRDVADATYRVLDRLPADERIALALRMIEEMELTEVAAACEVSLATIKRRLGKAQERFRAFARTEPALAWWAQRGDS